MINRNFQVQPPIPISNQPTTAKSKQAEAVNFRDILSKELQATPLKFSAHAQLRLEQRNIVFNKEDINKLAVAAQKIAAKGSRESLILYNDIPLVVNIPNRTVVTAFNNNTENLVTNIDSAMILK